MSQTNSSETEVLNDVDKAVEDILNIILKAGRSEMECVFIAHIIQREVDKFFDHVAESHEVRRN